MPRITDNTPLASQFLDRRVKLLDCQKEQMKRLYDDGEGVSINQLAKVFSVNKRLIQFTLFPERIKENRKRRDERGGWLQYYDKKKGTETQREHRNYKVEALKFTKS